MRRSGNRLPVLPFDPLVVQRLVVMPSVRVSPKYQVVIPREVRDQLPLTPGQQVEVFVIEGRIEIVPIRPMNEMRGVLKGMDTAMEREADRDIG